MKFTKLYWQEFNKQLVPQEKRTFLFNLAEILSKKGYSAEIFITGNNYELRRFKRHKYMPYNLMYSPDLERKCENPPKPYKKTRYLSWSDWENINKTINDFMDKFKVKGTVFTLGGKFLIRSFIRGRFNNWDNLADENVGSIMNPVCRINHIISED